MFKLNHTPNSNRKVVELNFDGIIDKPILDSKCKKVVDSVLIKSFVNVYKNVSYKIIYVAFKNDNNDLYCVYSINDVDGGILLIDSMYDIKSGLLK